MNDYEDFREWLSVEFGYSTRTTRDIVCRYERAKTLLGASSFSDAHEGVYLLERVPEFAKLSRSVKSQLRKSVRLSFQYLESKKLKP